MTSGALNDTLQMFRRELLDLLPGEAMQAMTFVMSGIDSRVGKQCSGSNQAQQPRSLESPTTPEALLASLYEVMHLSSYPHKEEYIQK